MGTFKTDRGWRTIPGGTPEPGESIEQTLALELSEEVSGALTGPLAWVGAFRVDHSRRGPYRPHLPFPISYWAYLSADVGLTHLPENPHGGEQVIAVHTAARGALNQLAAFDDGH